MSQVYKLKSERTLFKSMAFVVALSFILAWVFPNSEFLNLNIKNAIHNFIPMTYKLANKSRYPDLITIYYLIFWVTLPLYTIYIFRIIKVNKKFSEIVNNKKTIYILAVILTPLLFYIAYVHIGGTSSHGTPTFRVERAITQNVFVLSIFSSVMYIGLSFFAVAAIRIPEAMIKRKKYIQS